MFTLFISCAVLQCHASSHGCTHVTHSQETCLVSSLTATRPIQVTFTMYCTHLQCTYYRRKIKTDENAKCRLQNSQYGKELTITCSPNSSDDLCLSFCIYPSSTVYSICCVLDRTVYSRVRLFSTFRESDNFVYKTKSSVMNSDPSKMKKTINNQSFTSFLL